MATSSEIWSTHGKASRIKVVPILLWLSLGVMTRRGLDAHVTLGIALRILRADRVRRSLPRPVNGQGVFFAKPQCVRLLVYNQCDDL